MQSNKIFPIFGLISLVSAFVGSLPIAALYVLAFLTEFYSLRIVTAFFNDQGNEVLLGLIGIGILAILAVGWIFGLIGAFREKGNRIYALCGISFNTLILLFIVAAIIIGIYTEV